MKQDRSMRTHESLLDSAAAEFAMHGFVGTNLAEVAAKTGMTKGALYGHFASKSDLAVELTRLFDSAWGTLLANAQDGRRSPMDTVLTLIGELASRIEKDIRFAAGLRLARDSARIRAERPPRLVELQQVLAQLIAAAQETADIGRQHRPEVLARLTLALLLGALCTRTGTGTDDFVSEVHEMWRVVLPRA